MTHVTGKPAEDAEKRNRYLVVVSCTQGRREASGLPVQYENHVNHGHLPDVHGQYITAPCPDGPRRARGAEALTMLMGWARWPGQNGRTHPGGGAVVGEPPAPARLILGR